MFPASQLCVNMFRSAESKYANRGYSPYPLLNYAVLRSAVLVVDHVLVNFPLADAGTVLVPLGALAFHIVGESMFA